MDRLVKSLSTGKHNIDFESRTETLDELKERVFEMKFVFVKFTDTQGGTELGINVDDTLTDLSKGNFEKGTGKIKIAGTCELNYHKIRCYADVDLKTRKGKGYLEVLDG